MTAMGVIPSRIFEVKVLCRDRRLGWPEDGQIRTVTVEPADFQQLGSDLAAARVGFAQACRFNCTPLCGVDLRLTWYGAGTRTNSFVAGSDPDLPFYSLAVQRLAEDVLTCRPSSFFEAPPGRECPHGPLQRAKL